MKKNHMWLIVILLISLGLRLIALDQSLWLDEGIEWWGVTTFDLKRLLTGYMLGDFNPPGHHILMWFWVRVFGDSEISLRMPSVLFGVGTVAMVYAIAKVTSDKLQVTSNEEQETENKKQEASQQGNFLRTVLAVLQGPSFPALLAATNGLLIYYSQEARMYAMATFAVAGAVYWFLRYQRQQTHISYLLSHMFFLTLALYSHYLAWLMIPVFVIGRMRSVRETRDSGVVKGMKYAIPLLLTIPLWPLLVKQLQNGIASAGNSQWAMLSQTTPKNVALVFVKFVTGRIPFPERLELQVLVVALVVLFWVGVVRGVRAVWKVRKQRIIIFWLVVPLVLGGLTGLFVPVFSYFRFIFVLPAAILLFGRGIAVRGMGVIGFLSFSLLYLLSPSNHRENWREAVAEIHAQSITPIVLIHPAVRPPFDYYDRGRSNVELGIMSYESGEFWLIPYAQPIFDPTDSVRNQLRIFDFSRTFERHFNGMTIEGWNK